MMLTAMMVVATLTLADAQRLAVQRSRQVAAQDSVAEASRQMALAAGELPDPVLKVGIDNVPAEGGDRFSVARDFMTMRRIGLMQELPRSEKRALRRERYERELDRSAAEKSAAVAAVQRDTAVAFFERHYAEAMADVLGEQLRTARAEIESAEAGYRAGKGAQAD